MNVILLALLTLAAALSWATHPGIAGASLLLALAHVIQMVWRRSYRRARPAGPRQG
jgi:hypothetical protein